MIGMLLGGSGWGVVMVMADGGSHIHIHTWYSFLQTAVEKGWEVRSVVDCVADGAA